MLVAIISLLQVGDISRTSELRTAMKLHALQHVVDSWEYWRTLLSCFGPERKHKLMKKVMHFSYRNAGKTTLAHSIRKYIRSLLLPHAFTAVHFCHKRYSVTGLPPIVLRDFGVCEIVEHGCTIHTAFGKVKKGDLVCYQDVHGVKGIGFSLGFACVRLQFGAHFMIAVLSVCEPCGNGRWRRTSTKGIVASPQIRQGVPFASIEDEFVPAVF